LCRHNSMHTISWREVAADFLVLDPFEQSSKGSIGTGSRLSVAKMTRRYRILSE
jgi:hypothetical protein